MGAEYARLIQNLSHADMHRRRTDLTQLNTPQRLMKDTKFGDSQAYPYFIASVPTSMRAWAEKDPQLLLHIEQFAREKRVRFAVVLTSYHEGAEEKCVAASPSPSPSPPPASSSSGGPLHREIVLLVLEDKQRQPQRLSAPELLERLT